MVGEERLQVRLAALEEVAQVEGEQVGQDQEDQQEDIGERGREVAASSRRMMMPTLRMASSARSSGDGAENFVEPPGFQCSS